MVFQITRHQQGSRSETLARWNWDKQTNRRDDVAGFGCRIRDVTAIRKLGWWIGGREREGGGWDGRMGASPSSD